MIINAIDRYADEDPRDRLTRKLSQATAFAELMQCAAEDGEGTFGIDAFGLLSDTLREVELAAKGVLYPEAQS